MRRRRSSGAAALAASLVLSALVGTVGASDAAAAPVCPTVAVDGTVSPFPNGVAVDWSGCDVHGADLRGADLSFALLDGADLTGARLQGASLVGASLFAAHLPGASLVDADLTWADLPQAVLTNADLTGARLVNASLALATVTGAALAGADAAGLEGAPITGTPASYPTGWTRTPSGWLVGPKASMHALSVTAVSFAGADLTDADLSASTFLSSTFTGVTFTRTDLRGASFSGSDLTGSTGIGTAIGDATTSWNQATCADGKAEVKHDGRSCLRPVDTTAPVVTLHAPGSPFVVTRTLVFPVTTVETGSGVATYQSRWIHRTSGTTGIWYPPTVLGPSQGSIGAVIITGAWTDQRYCAQVQKTDYAGNAGATSAAACVEVVGDDRQLTPGAGWRSTLTAGYYGKTIRTTTTKGAALSAGSRSVRQAGILATTCPTCGSVAVYVGATKIGSISLVSRTTVRSALKVLPRRSATLRGVLRYVVTSPTGRLVRVDGFAVTGV